MDFSTIKKTYSELEIMVMFDMHMHGYDPHNPEDIKKFWAERLPKDDNSNERR